MAKNELLYVKLGDKGHPRCKSWQKWAPVC